MFAGRTPQAVNLGEEGDGPSLSSLSRSVLGQLQVEHLPKLLRPHAREFNSLEELSQVKHGSGRQEL
eukprot:1646917-Amphidinium_carterae.1